MYLVNREIVVHLAVWEIVVYLEVDFLARGLTEVESRDVGVPEGVMVARGTWDTSRP